LKQTILLLILFLVFVHFGCTRNVPDNNKNVYVHHDLQNAPNWVRAPNVEGGIAGIGSQKIGASGIDFARKNAIASARDSLANTIQVKVNNIIKNFTRSTGIATDETVDRVSTHVSKQCSSQLLSGSRHADTWISPSGELYALVVIRTDSAKNAIKQNTYSSFRNEKALWQQFEANKAFNDLDKEIDKEFGN